MRKPATRSTQSPPLIRYYFIVKFYFAWVGFKNTLYSRVLLYRHFIIGNMIFPEMKPVAFSQPILADLTRPISHKCTRRPQGLIYDGL